MIFEINFSNVKTVVITISYQPKVILMHNLKKKTILWKYFRTSLMLEYHMVLLKCFCVICQIFRSNNMVKWLTIWSIKSWKNWHVTTLNGPFQNWIPLKWHNCKAYKLRFNELRQFVAVIPVVLLLFYISYYNV